VPLKVLAAHVVSSSKLVFGMLKDRAGVDQNKVKGQPRQPHPGVTAEFGGQRVVVGRENHAAPHLPAQVRQHGVGDGVPAANGRRPNSSGIMPHLIAISVVLSPVIWAA
jgi:hypothetical protein